MTPTQFLAPSGPLAGSLPGYEYRAAQAQMAEMIAEAIRSQSHVAIEAGTGTGKCLSGRSLISLPCGSIVRIQDAVDSRASSVLSPVRGNLQIEARGVSEWFDNGLRSVVRVRTALGREIVATSNHPLLQLGRWTPISDLRVGDEVAIVRRTPHADGSGAGGISREGIEVLAFLIPDGSLSQTGYKGYTKIDPATREAFRQAMARIPGCTTRDSDNGKTIHILRTHQGRKKGSWSGHRNPCSVLVERFRLNERSPARVLPDEIMRLGSDDLSFFIGRLWSGDGSVEKAVVSYCSASALMIEQLAHILTRFGVVAKIRKKFPKYIKRNGERCFAFELVISNKENIRSFGDAFLPHIVGPKAQRLRDLLRRQDGIRHNPNVDLLPLGAWDVVERAASARGLSMNQIMDRCNVSMGDRKRARRLSRAKARLIGDLLGNDHLKALSDSDIYWDRITEIEPLDQPEPTFDLTVPDRHAFVANGFVVHNSQGYIIPAVLHALSESGSTAIISTGTIPLQEQLIGKDLPALVRAGLDHVYTLALGKSNYLCLQRLGMQAEEPTPEAEPWLQRLIEWKDSGGSGVRSEAPDGFPDALWRDVNVDGDACAGRKCGLYDQCLYYAARGRMKDAHVVVVNHSLFAAHLALGLDGRGILPEADVVILDEAHRAADAAAKALGSELSSFVIRSNLQRIQSGKDEKRGAIPALVAALFVDHDRMSRDLYVRNNDRLNPLRAKTMAAADAYFEELHESLGVSQARIQKIPYSKRAPDRAQKLIEATAELVEELADIVGEIEGLDSKDKRIVAAVAELGSVHRKLNAARGVVENTTRPPEDGMCRWITCESRKHGPVVTLSAAPVNAGDILQDALFGRYKSVVMTSATIATSRQGFKWFFSQIGAPPETRHAVLDSPFDFNEQALLAIPSDMPDPNSATFDAEAAQFIAEVVRISKGGALILFTSWRSLNAAYSLLEPQAATMGVTLLKQGGGIERSRLVAEMRSNDNVALLATESFWEGIDISGSNLRLLIISRLPFKVPTEPLEEARVELIEKRGGNPFMDYTLPGTIIRLKQGFGRLIRSKNDHGAVLLLDPRVLTKRYGAMVLAALPPAARYVAPRDKILSLLEREHWVKTKDSANRGLTSEAVSV